MAGYRYFRYAEEVIEHFPNIRAGAIIAHGLKNGPSPVELKRRFAQEQKDTLARIGETPLSEIETLSAWRGAFRAFGVNPTKSRSAPEALLRRLTKKGDIPSINTLVDIGNLVSIRYALPAAVFDTVRLHGGITVRFARGEEPFAPIFADELQHPEPGEVIFCDEQDTVVARRWCWRQSDDSAARETTSEAIIVMEAQHESSEEMVRAALGDWQALLEEFAGGKYQSGLLFKEQPVFSEEQNGGY
jgi:DNA/RNA-binding domain of Phe-tRNA-synthetase-like protein